MILARIDYILDRRATILKVYDGLIFLVALFARNPRVIQSVIGWVIIEG